MKLSQIRHLVNSQIDIPALSEPVSDYFLKLSTIKSSKMSDKFSAIAKEIETEILDGEVIFNSDTKKIEFIENYALDFDLYIDHKNKKAKHLGAKVTPEVFLLDQEYTIHYNGAIDNWFYSLGKNRNLITSHYLEDAMNSLLNGTKIQIPYVQAIGCYIE